MKSASFALILAVLMGVMPVSVGAANKDIVDTALMVNDSKVVKADIAASNRIIHAIDTVSLPDSN